MERLQRTRLVPVFALFLLSGATSLAYEVIWTRMLVRIFGATSFAVSTVLAAYMAGLALGSYLLGKRIDRRGSPILTYGLLELGIGCFALIFPIILAGLNPLYRSLYAGLEGQLYALSLIRFGLCFALLLVPTTLMGGTLPVLSRFVAGSLSELTFRVGWLYSINTFGAVAGTFLTGFVLLPHLGMQATTFVAVALNFTIFAVAYALSRRESPERGAGIEPAHAEAEARGDTPRPRGARHEKVVLVAFLATGLAALSAEVLWTRVLALVVGTTVYAFSIMLTVFLLGLAVGSAVFARLAQRTRRPGTLLAGLVGAIGFVVFASTVAFGRLPTLYMGLYHAVAKTWMGGLTIEFLLSGLVMVVPAFLMGGTFPLVARIYATDLARVGGRIGTAYAFNTVGSILGSFIGSFVLLQFLGVERGMVLVSLIYVAVAVALVAVAAEVKPRVRLAGSGFLVVGAVLVVVFAPGWNKLRMTSGVYAYAGMYETSEGMESDLRLKHLLFYDEGPGATVSVEQTQNTLSLKIDGKVDASNSTDMINQEILAHLPLLMHPQAETVLVIGLGSGVSLGSAEQHPVRHLDCVELLKNVVAAADCFKNDTHDCLHDPRVTLVLGDGRNHVLLSDKKYDVIISEPTNVWVSGVGDLFTVEFFRLARQRLKPGGVMSAWFYTYHMGDAELRAGIKAFTTIFPHTSMWLSNESDLVLVGTLEPSKIDEAFLARMNDPKVASDLARVGIHEPADLLGAMLLNEDQLAEYARPARLHTDDNMLMEFNSGRRLFQSTHEVHLANIVERLRPSYFKYLDAATNDRVMVQAQARKLAMEGSLTRLRGNTPEAVRLYDAAYAAAPLDPYVLSKYVEVHLQVGDALLGQQDFARAREHYERVAAAPAGPDLWVAYDGIGLADYYQNDFAGARDAFQTDITLNPNNSSGFARLGDVLIELADTTGAIKAYEQAVELAPWDLDTVNSLAWYYLERGLNLERALSLARQAARDGKQANYFDTLGCIYLKLSKLDEAAGALGRALRLEPQRTESIFHLALVRQAEGRTGDMRKLLQQVVALDTHGDWGAKARAMLGS